MKSQKEKSKTAGKMPALLNESLLIDIRNLIFSARRRAAQAANVGLTLIEIEAFWRRQRCLKSGFRQWSVRIIMVSG